MHTLDISFTHPSYPALLRKIVDPPSMLHVRGTMPASDAQMVSIVGTRHPDTYGIQATRMIASELAQAGVIVVSGLAFGIDAVAHRAALDAGGITIAVLGSGVDLITPTANNALGEEIIAKGGALISEQDNGTPALRHHIIARNRIVAGISHGLVVVQAAVSSGTIHTVNFANSYEHPVFAVPGNIMTPNAAGPNNLIRENRAVAVTSTIDILESLHWDRDSNTLLHQPSNADEARLFELLRANVNTTQAIIERSGLSASAVANTISMMEITGKITNLGAGHWALK